MTDLLLTGRLVTGHPMVAHIKTDNNNQPKLGKDGQPMSEYHVGVAIPKQGETDWKTTTWGQVINSVAMAAWTNNETLRPDFAWKVQDGDSQIPNKRGKIPAQREGWAGHWVVSCNTMIPIRCYHVGKYDPTQQIQDKNEIKTGDYCRVNVEVKSNNSTQTAGLYINPNLFELSRAGEQIMTDGGPAAADVFGGGAPASPQPVAAAPAPTTAPAPAPAAAPSTVPAAAPPASAPTAPAPDFLGQPQPAPAPAPAPAEESYNYNGQIFTKSALLAAGWAEDQVTALPRA